MLEHPLRTFIQPLMARVMRATHSKLVAANLIPHFDADPDCFFKDARSGSVHIMAASLIDDSFFNSIHLVPAICVTNVASIAQKYLMSLLFIQWTSISKKAELSLCWI